MRWAMQSSAFLNLGQGGRLPFYHYRAPSIRSYSIILPPTCAPYVYCMRGGSGAE